VPVVALADQRARKGGLPDLPGGDRAGAVADGGVVPGHHRPVVLLEIADALGEGGEGERVRAQIHLPVAIADRQRTAAARADHEVVPTGENDGEREGAGEARQHRRDRLFRGLLPVQLAGQQMGDDLGISLGLEAHALVLELGAQLLKVLDDAVMDQRHPLGGVGMRVGDGRGPMRRPAGVANADRPRQRRAVQLRFQARDLAFGPAPLYAPIDQRRHAGRIVAAIFQPLQPVQQQRRDRPPPDNPNDPAHSLCSVVSDPRPCRPVRNAFGRGASNRRSRYPQPHLMC